jgi:hypothetical protein
LIGSIGRVYKKIYDFYGSDMRIIDKKILDYIPIVSLVKAMVVQNERRQVVAFVLKGIPDAPCTGGSLLHTYALLRSDSPLRKFVMSFPILGNFIVLCADLYAGWYARFLLAHGVCHTEGNRTHEVEALRGVVTWGRVDVVPSMTVHCVNRSERVAWLQHAAVLGDVESMKMLGDELLALHLDKEAVMLYDMAGPRTRSVKMSRRADELLLADRVDEAASLYMKSGFLQDLLKLANHYYALGGEENILKGRMIDAKIEQAHDGGVGDECVPFQLASWWLNGENHRVKDSARAERLLEWAIRNFTYTVRPDILEDDDAAIAMAGNAELKGRWSEALTKAAHQGNGRAMVWLGCLSEKQVEFFAPDSMQFRSAAEWYLKAGKAGRHEAWLRLGNLYRGVNTPEAQLKAQMYVVRAAMTGNAKALLQLIDVRQMALVGASPGQQQEILQHEFARLEKELDRISS